MKIPTAEQIEVNKIVVDTTNPNKMNDRQFNSLKMVIEKYGFIVPIVTNKDLVIADGYHRWKAARELGMEKVPVIKLDLKEVDRKILRQVLNKLKGSHDRDLDKIEYEAIFSEMAREEFMDLTALSENEVDNIINKQEIDTPTAEEVNQLYKHTVTCPKCGHKFQKVAE